MQFCVREITIYLMNVEIDFFDIQFASHSLKPLAHTNYTKAVESRIVILITVYFK